MNKRCFIVAILFAFLANNVFAKDPISWTLDQAFPNPVIVAAGTYSVQYTLKNEIPLTLVNPLKISTFPSSAEFSFVDNCTGKKLTPNQTCTVGINLVPTVAGIKSVYIVIEGYDKNQVPLPALTTTASGNTGITIIGTTITPLPSTMQVNESANFKFRFTNNGTAAATGVSVSSNYVDFSSDCGTVLNAGAFCEGAGSFMPVSNTPTVQTVTATFDFAQGPPVTVQTSTTIVAPPSSSLIGTLIQGLPAVTIPGQVYPVDIRFTNNGTNTINGITQNNTYPDPGVIFTQNSPNCPASLTAGQFCDVTGTFTAPNPPPASPGNCYAVAVQLVPGANPPPPVTISTDTCVIPQSTTGRTITLVNQCNFPVWFSLNGANRQNNQANIPCTVDANCPTGSRCNPNAAGGTGLCFWENYAPADNNFQLNNGASNTVFIPDSDPLNTSGILWSGSISASTGCSGGSCVTANCENMGGATSCNPGVGFGQPATQAEFTFEKGTVDTYDVEVINGFHIPIQMEPDAAISDGYTCGIPGDTTQSSDFGACNWNNAVVPNTTYNWVTSGGTPCSEGLDSGLNKVCGKFLGFWTANQACAVSNVKANDYFNCDLVLGSPYPPTTTTLSDLYQCSTQTLEGGKTILDSCYQNGADNTCCGCANWRDLPLAMPIILPASTQLCKSASTQWVGNVQNTLLWMKQACPNYYTYPFDDASSTFTCNDTIPNSQDYTVTFCQGTFTGLPATAVEGRDGS